MKKKFWGILVLSLSIMVLLSTNVSASEDKEVKVSDLFINFIDRVFDSPSKVIVLDSSGSDYN